MKQFSIVFFCMIFISCSNRKNTVSEDKSNCEIKLGTSEELQQQYLHFTKDCSFCEKEFENFKKVKKGVLLYHWKEGIGSNQFLIVDFDKGFSFFIKSEDFTKQKDFILEDKKKLSFILEALEKGNYYQSCEGFDGHSDLYVLIVRNNDEMKVQYFSGFTDLYKVKTADINVSSIKEVFEIMERNYYRSIPINKK